MMKSDAIGEQAKYKGSVLIVDNDQAWQNILRESLTHLKYQVEIAASYEEAQNILDRKSFDVAVVEVRLNEKDQSNLDGMRVIAHIHDTGKPIGIIILSGYMPTRLVKDAFQRYEVLDFIDKKEPDYTSLYDFSRGDSPLERLINVIDERIRSKNEKNHSANIFISYARTDVAMVQQVYKSLLNKNHRPWMDVYSLKGGENWLRAIYKAIDECEIFLAILSNNSISRRGVIQKELKKALDKWDGMLPDDIYIVPLRIDDCPIPDLLKDLQVINWDNGKGRKKLLEAISIGMARRKANG